MLRRMNELSTQTRLKQCFVGLSIVGLLGFAASWWRHSAPLANGAGLILITAFVLGLFVSQWVSYRFTLWILIANLSALLAPQWFLSVGGFSLTDSWLLLVIVQSIMFGMGTQMSLRDLAQVALMPKGVLVGLTCQFTIMPLLGFTLAHLFRLPPEIAAGVILIGSCSSGLASNVMCYIAKGNLALSVAITALATAMAPIMTPLWMKTLAGSLVEVDAFKMSLDIVKMGDRADPGRLCPRLADRLQPQGAALRFSMYLDRRIVVGLYISRRMAMDRISRARKIANARPLVDTRIFSSGARRRHTL